MQQRFDTGPFVSVYLKPCDVHGPNTKTIYRYAANQENPNFGKENQLLSFVFASFQPLIDEQFAKNANGADKPPKHKGRNKKSNSMPITTSVIEREIEGVNEDQTTTEDAFEEQLDANIATNDYKSSILKERSSYHQLCDESEEASRDYIIVRNRITIRRKQNY